MYLYSCRGKYSLVDLVGVAGCMWVSVHTTDTVIMTDLGKYFTWQKQEFGIKKRTNKKMCSYMGVF